MDLQAYVFEKKRERKSLELNQRGFISTTTPSHLNP